ncbi:MAG: hypothetical protein QM783_01895 [Phycisphaerales bacterium]
MGSSSSVRTGLVSAAVLFASAGSAFAQWSVTFQPVVTSSGPVPGVAGAQWNTAAAPFSSPSVDNAGNVAFRGVMLTGVGGVTGNANAAADWYGPIGGLSIVARDGAAGPTLTNPNNWVHNSTAGAAGLSTGAPALAPNGAMLITSALNGTGAVNNSNNSAAWSGASGSMSMIAQRGVGNAAGATHALFDSNMNLVSRVNNAGQVILASNLKTDGDAGTDIVAGSTTTSNDSGLWVASSSGMTMIARENALTSIGGGTQFGELGTVSGGQINGAGQVAFYANLRTGIGGVATSGLRNDGVLWSNAGTGGMLTAIARKNDAVPGLSGVSYFNGAATAFNLGSQGFNNSGRAVYDAQFGTGWATGTANEALMTWTASAGASVLVRTADPAFGVAGATYNLFNTTNSQHRLNNNNVLIYAGSMLGTAGGTTDDEAIWQTTITAAGAASNTQILAREGQAIPGQSGLFLGGSLTNASQMIMNNLNQVVFVGTVTGSGVTTSNDQCVFAWDPTLGLTMLFREGDASTIAGLSGNFGSTNVAVSPFSISNLGNGEGGAVALSDTGWLALTVTTGSGSAVVLAQIPAPGAAAALGLAAVAAGGGRRRRC